MIAHDQLINSLDYDEYGEKNLINHGQWDDYLRHVTIYDRVGRPLYSFKWLDPQPDFFEYERGDHKRYSELKQEMIANYKREKYQRELNELYRK